MYIDLVKDLLKKHFGLPRCSLVIGDTKEPQGRAYYYHLDKERQITALKDLLNMNYLVGGIGKLPELSQTIPEKDDDCADISQCVSFRESDGRWAASFHIIKEVYYHPTYSNRAAAVLRIDENPFVILSDSDDEFFGFWRKWRTKKPTPYNERNGLSYWMNKALKTNERFRRFAADFFYGVAEIEHKYILKDVARTIEKCGCFLPPVSYHDLLDFRTPAELIRGFETEDAKLNVDFNKIDLNVGYIMAKLAPEIDARDRAALTKLDAKTVADSISLNLFYDGFSAAEFVRWYYRKALEPEGDEYEIKMYADDYVKLCTDLGEKFRISYNLDGLIRAHDDLTLKSMTKANEKELKRPLVATPSKFDALEEAIKKTGTTEFERICTTERLLREGEYQHNCVFSRRALVRRDSASIYHWEHKGCSYTIQFSADRKRRYSVREVRARFNRRITEEHLNDLKKILSGICTVGDDAAAGFPREDLIPAYPQMHDIDMNDPNFIDDLPF